MYLCNNCGEQFEAPATYIEAYTDGGNAVASGRRAGTVPYLRGVRGRAEYKRLL